MLALPWSNPKWYCVHDHMVRDKTAIAFFKPLITKLTKSNCTQLPLCTRMTTIERVELVKGPTLGGLWLFSCGSRRVRAQGGPKAKNFIFLPPNLVDKLFWTWGWRGLSMHTALVKYQSPFYIANRFSTKRRWQ